jgi:hypothetical protein
VSIGWIVERESEFVSERHVRGSNQTAGRNAAVDSERSSTAAETRLGKWRDVTCLGRCRQSPREFAFLAI